MTEYGDTQSSITVKDLKNQRDEIVNMLSEHVTKEVQKSNYEIMSSQHEMIEREEAIQELLITRQNTKNVYYVGLLTGIVGIIAGFFSNIIYSIAGAGVAITAIVGIIEAKKNKW